MDKRLGQGVVSSGKKIARQAARQVAQEPLEIAKSVGGQVTGIETSQKMVEGEVFPEARAESAAVSQEEEKEIKERGQRILEALEVEIKDIRKQKEAREKHESRGQEAEAKRKKEESKRKPLQEVGTKPSRKFVAGIKGKVSRLKRKTELRLPPTG